MKRFVITVLVLAILLNLSACHIGIPQGDNGKGSSKKKEPQSEAEMTAENLITQLGDITLESLEKLNAAQEALDAIPYEKQDPEMCSQLLDAWDAYYDLAVAGSWCDGYFSTSFCTADSIEYMKTPTLTLNADHTFVKGEESGGWYLSQGILHLEGITWGDYEMRWSEGMLCLYGGAEFLYPAHWFQRKVEEAFRVVDLEKADPADYLRVDKIKTFYKDEWGELTDYYGIHPAVCSAYDAEWVLVNATRDFQIEIFIPRHQHTFQETGGAEQTLWVEEASWIDDDSVFGGGIGNFSFEEYQQLFRSASRLEGKDFTFGRAKGKLCFARKEYVSYCTEGEYRYMEVTFQGQTYRQYAYPEIYSGS